MPALPQHIELEPRASDFLDLLRDLGHIDEAALERLTAELLQQPRSQPLITFDEVRQRAAMLLFEHDATLRPENREILNAEWSRLFY